MRDPTAAITPYDRLVADEAKVTTWLARGERKRELIVWFGHDAWAELSRLAKAASSAARRSRQRRGRGAAHRVWIVPGIMGTQLGRPRPLPFPADILWLDPLDVIVGRLTQLRFSSTDRIRTYGVLLHSYLRLKLRLQSAGYDVRFFEYDWRASITASGARFAVALRADGREASIVAHSLGGLVTRSALLEPGLRNAGGRPIRRVVLLGTPNFGAFAAVQALRGTYSVVRKLAMLDLRHTAEALATKVFTSLPSLYDLLPFGPLAAALSLHDPAVWPLRGPRPQPQLLRDSRELEASLAPSDPRFVVIAGYGERTVTAVERQGADFLYRYDHDGDGTVPLTSAALPGAPCYFVASGHSDLARDATVANAVAELLGTGQTDLLSTTLPSQRGGAAPLLISDTELRQTLLGKVDWAELTMDERRRFLETLNDSGPLPGAPRSAGDARSKHTRRAEMGYRQAASVTAPTPPLFEIGDVRTVRDSALAVAVLEDVRPTGATSALDETLQGAITEFRFRRMLGGEVGRVTWVPSRKGPQAVLLVGIGHFDTLSAAAIEFAAENVMRLCLRAGFARLTTIPWGAGAGFSVGESVAAQWRGFARALQWVPDHALQVLPAPPVRVAFRFRNAAARDSAIAALDANAKLSVEPIQQAPIAPRTPVTVRAPKQSVYLMISAAAARIGSEAWRASVLTASSPAAVVSELQHFATRELIELVAGAERSDFSSRTLRSLGTQLAELVLHPTVRAALRDLAQAELVIVHDAPTSRVPWETLVINGHAPALERGMSRRYAAAQLSLARFGLERRRDRRLRVLLIADPTENLPGAALEGQRIEKRIRSLAGAEITVVNGRAATRGRVLSELASGSYDVMHYAGHAAFDAAAAQRSGLVCSDQALLGVDLRDLSRLPSLVVFNACESGRIRRVRKAVAGSSAGLAEALMRAGIANFIGTWWPVSDAAALRFGETFYGALIGNRSLGAALLAARRRIAASRSPDWADYIHYGDPDFTLKDDPVL